MAPGPGQRPAGSALPCAALRQATGRGRPLQAGEAGLLDAAGLCGWCAAGLVVPGPQGRYLTLAWYLLAARAWVSALEDAAPSADWLACAQWSARTPFTEPCPVPALIAGLPAGQRWAACRAAARATCTPAEFVTVLWRYRAWRGNPTWRDMAVNARQIVVHSTICKAMKGNDLPTLDVVKAIILGCGGSQEELDAFTFAWHRLREGTRDGQGDDSGLLPAPAPVLQLVTTR